MMEQPKIYPLEEYRKMIGVLQPRYSLTKGLTNQAVLKAMRQALTFYEYESEYYPDHMIAKYDLTSYKEAIASMHFPVDFEQLVEARRRIVFDEFFEFLLYLRKNKELTAKIPNPYPMFETADTVRFLEQLPFPLTRAQKKVWQELREDLGSHFSMNRLIQGERNSSQGGL